MPDRAGHLSQVTFAMVSDAGHSICFDAVRDDSVLEPSERLTTMKTKKMGREVSVHQ
jgi:hypothetical protein